MSDQENRIPPLQYSPVRERWYASANFLAALEAVSDGCREIVDNETLDSPIAKAFMELWEVVEPLIATYGSPRPPEANEEKTNG